MNPSEHLAKTPKAWEALSRPDVVGRQAHTLILMANGRRGVKELSLLLGDDVSHLAQEMLQQGYLQKNPVPAAIEVDDDLPPRG